MKSHALHFIMAWKMSNDRESGALTKLYFKLSQCLGLRLSPTCATTMNILLCKAHCRLCDQESLTLWYLLRGIACQEAAWLGRHMRPPTSTRDVGISKESIVENPQEAISWGRAGGEKMVPTCRTCVMPRACSTLRSLSAATDPMKTPGLMHEGISLRADESLDSSSLDDRWEDALLSSSSDPWDQSRLNSPPAAGTVQHYGLFPISSRRVSGTPALNALELDTRWGGDGHAVLM